MRVSDCFGYAAALVDKAGGVIARAKLAPVTRFEVVHGPARVPARLLVSDGFVLKELAEEPGWVPMVLAPGDSLTIRWVRETVEAPP